MLQAFSRSCNYCGRVYTKAGLLTRHAKLCTKGKKWLAGVLAKAREIYHSKKNVPVYKNVKQKVYRGALHGWVSIALSREMKLGTTR